MLKRARTVLLHLHRSTCLLHPGQVNLLLHPPEETLAGVMSLVSILNTFDAIYCGWYLSATQRVLDTTLLRAVVQELGCTLTQPFSCCEIMTDAA
jgi:hypothetical protein